MTAITYKETRSKIVAEQKAARVDCASLIAHRLLHSVHHCVSSKQSSGLSFQRNLGILPILKRMNTSFVPRARGYVPGFLWNERGTHGGRGYDTLSR